MGILSELVSSFFHPREITAMLSVKYGGKLAQREFPEPLEELAKTLGDNDFCYATLHKVSRSFAVVIQQLPEDLKDPICIFYLVLRGLDSVEDDMTYPLDKKLPLLRAFYEKLNEDGWRISGVGDSDDYRVLLAHFDKVIRIHKGLKPEYRAPIEDICRRMGEGMAKYATKKVTTIAEYDEYCHYVAGLVGYGLSALFSASGLEDPELKNQLQISNSMGLFLQKTNIIRDYLEDLDSDRTWWPNEVWSQYAPELAFFKHHPTDHRSVSCLNHLVTDALRHVPDCLTYMSKIRDPQVFRFCAIPQVMAIGTLAAVYNNTDVFRKVVKIRKGLSCHMLLHTNTLADVRDCFRTFALDMEKRVPANDPSRKRTLELLDQVKSLAPAPLQQGVFRALNLAVVLLLVFVTVHLMSRFRERHTQFPDAKLTEFARLDDYASAVALFLSVAYLFGFFGTQYV